MLTCTFVKSVKGTRAPNSSSDSSQVEYFLQRTMGVGEVLWDLQLVSQL